MANLRYGYIGLGNIGGPMAENLIGEQLAVFDAFAQATAPFEGKAYIANSPADLGRHADLVGVCVRDEKDVLAVVAGDDGLLSTMTSGIIAIHSTIRASTVQALAKQAADKGVTLIDAAVTGGREVARNAQLTCMVGGAPADIDKARRLLDHYCIKIVHAGGSGTGMTLKIANNLVTYVELAVATEAYRLAEAEGLDPAQLDEVMTANGNLSPAMKAFTQGRRKMAAAELAASPRPAGAALVPLATKDLSLACEIAEDLNLDLSLGAFMRDHFGQIISGAAL